MKKNILSIVVLGTLLLVFSSCGPKLLTEEEVSKKVEETFDAQVEALEAVLDKECEERFDGLVVLKRDSILAVMEEEE